MDGTLPGGAFSLPGVILSPMAPGAPGAPAAAPAALPPPVPTRFVRESGPARCILHVWEASSEATPCATGRGAHEASAVVPGLPADYTELVKVVHADDFFDREEMWPKTCAYCDFAFSPCTREGGSWRSLGPRRTYDTPSGDPEVGDLFYVLCEYPDRCWTNCSGRHLHVIVPDGTDWDIDSRAGNCTLKEDRIHRCWVRTGDPELGEPVTVGKGGLTCDAGGGSILTRSYHGFLTGGELKAC